jgi:DNA polymerase-3 subunit delta'
MSLIYPWQHLGYQRLLRAKRQQRLPHGLLLTAKAGSGLDEFCRYWSQHVLCVEEHDAPCGQCKSCLLFQSNSHPDFYWVSVLEGKKQIAIDQIRQLSSQLHETASLSGWRVAVVYQAERLTISAFNALLKTLEEPGTQTLLVLAANDRSSIPATIISRCQHLPLDASQQDVVKDWLCGQYPDLPNDQVMLALELTHFAPLAAASLIENKEIELFQEVVTFLLAVFNGKLPATEISDFNGVTPEQLFMWWEFLISTMIRYQTSGQTSPLEILQRAYKLAESADVRLLFKLRDNILFQVKELREGVSLNINMQIDQLAIEWQKCCLRTS